MNMTKTIAASLLLILPMTSFGQFETRLTMENDTFLKQDDSDYTHGTKFEIVDDVHGMHYMV